MTVGPNHHQTQARPTRSGAPQSNRRTGLLWTLAVLCLGVAGYALVNFGPLAFGRSGADASPLRNASLHPVLLGVHAISGAAALLLGVFQCLAMARRFPADLHRRVGIAYVAAVALSGGAGGVLALSAEGGWLGRTGFACLAASWLATTLIGVLNLRAGDYAAHRRNMTRSFALSCAAVSLRVLLPLALVMKLDFQQAYSWIAWLCWVPNLMIAEWLMRRK